MISIIIPTYNGLDYLKKYSIPSVLNQTYKDFELIIINDGSNDGTMSFLNTLKEKDKRIKIINQRNNGLADSLNRGVEISKGDYIFILEHDDIWLPNKLEEQLAFLKNGIKICYCKAIEYDLNKNKFKNINNGNLSCLSFNKEVSNIFFPLPKDKKYLGIEDGIITAKTQLALANQDIDKKEILNMDKILTIMNTSNNTLSGKRNNKTMMIRYKSVLNLFKKYYKIDEIKNLLKFWRKHYIFNLVLHYIPLNFKNIIFYNIYNYFSNKNNSKKIKNLKKNNLNEYNYLINYRNKFN